MKNIFYILVLASFLIHFGCKKESNKEMPVIATQTFNDSLFSPTSTFTFIATSGAVNGYPNIDTAYYYLPASVKVTSQSTLTSSYKWYLRRFGLPDSLMSTLQNASFNLTFILAKASIVLITNNSLGSSTVVKPFQIKSAPSALKLTAITIDTMAFVNSATSLPWNSNGFPNVFCQIVDGSILVMDTMNGTGWSSAPSTVANIYPIKDSLTTLPYTIKYPSTIRTFTISSSIVGASMLDTFNINIYNKNITTNPDLIGSVKLIPSIYFGGSLPTTIYVNNFAQNIYLRLSVQWQ